MLANSFEVASANTVKENDVIFTKYQYQTNEVETSSNGSYTVVQKTLNFEFKTHTKVPKTGVMIVGLGGNNGTTLTCGLMANKRKLSWLTRTGKQSANFYGSLTQCSTTYLGDDAEGNRIFAPFNKLLPMIDPTELTVGGWDISSMNMYDATLRAQVMEPGLISQLEGDLKKMHPLPAIFDQTFVAPNQSTRADNVLTGTKKEQVEKVRQQIRDFKEKNSLESVIVLWSANTERYCHIAPEVHQTAKGILLGIENNHPEISPSIMYAVASILEGVPYINGSPQNTLIPGIVELAVEHKVAIMGDDFKTGQTKFKSVVADFLISSGLKLTSCASYNHLGNNDGLNLSFEDCFKSKEISKASVIDDMVQGNPILYPNGEHPDHIVVIKYVKSVGDSKRALDEYNSTIFCGGKNCISVHNTCEDSLLAAPLMMDLIVLMELFTRVYLKSPEMEKFEHMHSVLSALSFLLKAPRTPPGTPVVNSLTQQRACLENILRACRGLPPIDHMHLEYKLPKF